MERRRILKTVAAGSTVPALSAAGGVAQSPPTDNGPRRTNGDPDAPAAIITGGRGDPIPDHAVRNKRRALINRVGVERGALEQHITSDDEDLLAYGVRIEGGNPVEYFNSIPKSANSSAYRWAAEIAHDRARRFKRGEL
jgi:hypothetical protein